MGTGPQQRCSARYDLTRRWRRPHPLILQQTLSCPLTLRRVAMTLLFILLPAASGWAVRQCLSAAGLHLRLNVGQLTVPAD